MTIPAAIYLVGFMGCGKSTIGRRLADRLGWRFLDLDAEIEAEVGETISAMFEREGEPYFRAKEAAMLDRISGEAFTNPGFVLALGGGAFVQPKNRDLLEGRGVSLWLDVPYQTALRRVRHNPHRPLARDETRFRALFDQRRPVYALADFHIPIVSDNPEVTVGSIVKLPLPAWKK